MGRTGSLRTLWDVNAIAFKDIPTVQDLIRAADEKVLAACVVDRVAADWGASVRAGKGAGSSDREAGMHAEKKLRRARKRVRAVLREMARIDVKRSKVWCLFPERAFGADPETGDLSCELRCALVRRSDFSYAACELAGSRPAESREAWRESLGDRRDAGRFRAMGRSPHTATLPTCGCGFATWRKLLGYRVWLGGDFTRKERYLALADVVCEALRYGLTESDATRAVKAERRDIAHARAESERDRRAYPGEVVVARCGQGDFGLAAPEDDFEEEYAFGMMDLACSLNHNEHLDLCRRVAQLARMVETGYRLPATA